MEKITLNINNLGDNGSFIKIPMNSFFIPMDNTEIAENDFLQDAIEESINPIEDYEKKRFIPWNNIDEVIIRFKQTGATPIYYDYFGHSYDDVRFLRNSFKNSFVKLNFYDSPNPSNRRLAFQSIIYNQVNEDQRDVITKQPLPINTMPITYRIVDPIRVRKGVSEGFYLYWLNNPPNNTYPINFYMTAAYHNALDGVITPLLAYDSTDVIQNPLYNPNIPMNLYNGFNYVKYTLTSINGLNQYKIDMDNTLSGFNYRTISVVGTKLYIDLYIPSLA